MLLDMYRNREIPNLKMCLKTWNERTKIRNYYLHCVQIVKVLTLRYCKNCILVMILKMFGQTQTGSEKDEGSDF